MRAGSLAGGEQASVVVFLPVFVCFGRFCFFLFFWLGGGLRADASGSFCMSVNFLDAVNSAAAV